jgi:hypothetical protein
MNGPQLPELLEDKAAVAFHCSPLSVYIQQVQSMAYIAVLRQLPRLPICQRS